jgi:hypothetical protein
VSKTGAPEVWALTHLFDAVGSSYAVSCSAPANLWRRYQRVFDATAKTFLANG